MFSASLLAVAVMFSASFDELASICEAWLSAGLDLLQAARATTPAAMTMDVLSFMSGPLMGAAPATPSSGWRSTAAGVMRP